ncbi:MAG: DUF4012 domain-containing protein [Patescibacteria group bacterium]
MEKSIVAIFSESNFLSLNLVENLLSKNCHIFVFATDKKRWIAKTGHISKNANLSILDEVDFQNGPNLNYAIFNLKFEKFKRIYQPAIFKDVKSLAMFPFESFNSNQDGQIPLNGNLAVVYLGDIIGPRIDLDGELFIEQLMATAINTRELTLPVGEVFYPMFVSDVAREIVRWIFSFGPYGKELFLLGSQISGTEMWAAIAKGIPNLKLRYNNNLTPRKLPRNYEIKNIVCNLNFTIRETFIWLSKKYEKKVNITWPKIKPRFRLAKTISLIILPILLLPFLLIFLNIGLFYLSFKNFVSGNSDEARKVLLFSKTPSFIGREESRILEYIPLIGGVYEETFFALDLSLRGADIITNSTYLIDTAKELADRVLGNEVYDPEKYSSEIKVGLDYIYQGISLIEVDTMSQADKGVYLARKLLNDFDFTKAKKLSLRGSNIMEKLADILGKNERVSYLILFQNNMELRPTGGFIGSFGILTLEGGRMTDLTVSDVYSADGQLKGHIEPPEAIRKYLGEANWWLRDSNWDPDFPTSARRAEWFIDKEIDRQVGGVITFDLYPIKDLLGVTGPIYLADYEMDITSDNLYEKTQSEVHEDFFPGTHKKASFLTALSRNLVAEVLQLPPGKKLEVLKVIYQGLEERHIQAYLHDQKVQDSISVLNWSGEVQTPTCGENCYADLIGIVEANVGVNKANYFITRNQEIEVTMLPDKVIRKLKLTLVNSANPGLGLVGKYKAYIRILVTEGSEPKEIEFLAEVLGGDSQEYTVSWSSPLNGLGNYGLYLRKQAGTGEGDKASVAINGSLLYNSNLTRDIWIQKP